MNLFHTPVDMVKVNEIIKSGTFHFTKGKGCVKITPMNKAFSMAVIRDFKRDMCSYIKELACYKNAVYAAMYFNSRGYDVKVVEGWYRINKDRFMKDNPFCKCREGWGTHRWIIVNGKHVDITLDCTHGRCKTRHCEYRSERVYEAEDLYAFALKTGIDCTMTETPKWCSTLDGINYEILNTPSQWSLVNEFGTYVCLRNNNTRVA